MPEHNNLVERSAAAIELARAAGAAGAYAVASQSRSAELRYRDGALEKVQEATSRGLSVELYVEGRYGAFSTSDLRPEPLRSFIAEAVALTRALEVDPDRRLPEPALHPQGPTPELGVYDPGLAELSPGDQASRCEEVHGLLRQEGRAISATATWEGGWNASAAASSSGWQGQHRSTFAWMGADLTLKDDGDARPEGGAWMGGCRSADLPTTSQLAGRALERARQRLGSRKGPTLRGTMVVEPEAGGRLLGALLRPANARSVQQARSWCAGKVGQELFSPALELVDDPLLPGGLGSRPYDGEGLASRRMPIIADRRLQNLYVDTYYGRKAGLAPTTGSMSNLIVRPGDKDLAALIAEVGEGVLVTSWLGGNNDDNTGDFSFGMRGHRIEGGKVGAPVGEMNVTGSLVQLFGQLAAVGNDPYPWARIRVPTMVFEGVQFSGA
jgi:PmbA protein